MEEIAFRWGDTDESFQERQKYNISAFCYVDRHDECTERGKRHGIAPHLSSRDRDPCMCRCLHGATVQEAFEMLESGQITLDGKSPTFVPADRMGWWGDFDTRERCTKDDKVVLSKRKADMVAFRTGMSAYLGKCGHYHVGHSRKLGAKVTFS